MQDGTAATKGTANMTGSPIKLSVFKDSARGQLDDSYKECFLVCYFFFLIYSLKLLETKCTIIFLGT